MSPIRRYLRLTKYTVLKVLIYLDQPSLLQTWLLNPHNPNPVLPRIIKSIRPYILPKLREENERLSSSSKSKNYKKGVKDTVSEEDFEVSIFLTDTTTRHVLLRKEKVFEDKEGRAGVKRRRGELRGWLTGTEDRPLVVDDGKDDEDGDDGPVVIREESDDDDEEMNVNDFPEIPPPTSPTSQAKNYKNKNKNKNKHSNIGDQVSDDEGFSNEISNSNSTDPNKATSTTDEIKPKENQDDKKKLGLKTSYDGFNIYGRTLCLVVKRKGGKVKRSYENYDKSTMTGDEREGENQQQMLENWVSTQAALDQGQVLEDN